MVNTLEARPVGQGKCSGPRQRVHTRPCASFGTGFIDLAYVCAPLRLIIANRVPQHAHQPHPVCGWGRVWRLQSGLNTRPGAETCRNTRARRLRAFSDIYQASGHAPGPRAHPPPPRNAKMAPRASPGATEIAASAPELRPKCARRGGRGGRGGEGDRTACEVFGARAGEVGERDHLPPWRANGF